MKTIIRIVIYIICVLSISAEFFVGGEIVEASSPASKLVLEVESVTVKGCKKLNEAEIRRLIPELNNKQIRIGRLSKQIQLVKDSKSVDIDADFQPVADGVFKLVVSVKELRTDMFSLSLSNTGNEYTGKWRANLGWISNDITGHGDKLGLFYVTSPTVHDHDDVRQAAVVYKMVFPKSGDTAFLSYSYSDVDMGTIGTMGALTMEATGRGWANGIHYQHNIEYTSAHKKILDFGYDFKKYDNAHSYHLSDIISNGGHKFSVNTGSITYMEVHRWDRQLFAGNIGFTFNFDGDQEKYEKYRHTSNANFKLWSAGLTYQACSKNNWIASIRLNGQYTRDSIIYSDQLGAGGSGTVRGFKDRCISADNGIIGNFEIYTPPVLKKSRFLFFVDYADLRNTTNNFSDFSRETIGSFGIGYRFYDEKSDLSISIDYAKVFDRVEKETRDNTRPWHVLISKSF